MPAKRIRGYLYREALRPLGAHVIGYFEDGVAAITEYRYGHGVAYLVGSLPSLAYEIDRDSSSADWVTAFANSRSVKVQQEIVSGQPLVTRIHRYAEGYLLFALNWSSTDAEVILTVEGIKFSNTRASVPIEYLSASRLRISLPPMEGCLVVLN